MKRQLILTPIYLLILLCTFFLLPSGFAGADTVNAGADLAAFDYLIPSHSSIPQNQLDDYVVDLMLKQNRELIVSLYADEGEGKALIVWHLKREPGTATSFNWDGVYGGKLIALGDYRFSFAAGAETRVFPFTVTAPEEPLPLQITGEGGFLPLSTEMSDIWETMMAPIPVADAGALYHQPLYDAPGGKKIGHVHGSTAGLVILGLNGDGYARVGAFATEDGSYIEGYMKQKKLKMVRPNTQYGLLIDKKTQTMSIYAADEKEESGLRLLGTLPVSTGLMDPGKMYRETRAGAFVTQKRMPSFTSNGFHYDYAIRIDGGNLLHEAGHKLVDRQKDFSEQAPLLGLKASAGCVRIDPILSEDGLNALWLWEHLPRHTKVMVLDDPDARMARLVALGERPQSATPLQPQPNPTAQTEPFVVEKIGEIQDTSAAVTFDTAVVPIKTITLIMTFMGDCIIGSEEKSRKLPESFDSTILKKGYAWPFSGVQDILKEDDLSIINFEGVLKNDTRGKVDGRLHWFRGPVDFARVLPAGSIEIAGLANNHMRDYGRGGHNGTKEAIEKEGLATFGYFDTHIHEHQGLKIGFGGIRETIWRQKPELPNEEIAELKAAGCNYIVYTIHAGQEYNRQHTALQTKMAHAIIDAGADLIIGAHPHVVQGIEQYKQGLIVYSLGNFTFGGNLKLTEFDGLMVQVVIQFEGNQATETSLKLIPVLTTGTMPENDYRPIPAEGKDKARILKLIQNDSKGIKIEDDIHFVHEIGIEKGE